MQWKYKESKGKMPVRLIGGLCMAKKAAKPEAKAKATKEPKKTAAKEPKAAKAKAPKEKAATPAAGVEEVTAVEAVEVPVVKPKKEKKPSAKALKAAAALTAAAHESNKKWNDLKEKFGKDKAAQYSMSASFEANTPIMHKSFGWGYILTNDNNRLEVLFETGTRQLISNYKP